MTVGNVRWLKWNNSNRAKMSDSQFYSKLYNCNFNMSHEKGKLLQWKCSENDAFPSLTCEIAYWKQRREINWWRMHLCDFHHWWDTTNIAFYVFALVFAFYSSMSTCNRRTEIIFMYIYVILFLNET